MRRRLLGSERMLFGKKQSLVGLDIGSHAVKVVELEAQANRGHRLVNWGISAPLAGTSTSSTGTPGSQ